jgi:chemotaxis protein histidine kinase CheA
MAQTLDPSSSFNAFLGEVRGTLLLVEQSLLRLGPTLEDRQALEAIYRQTHAIGTQASMMHCPSLAQLAHGMAGMLGNILDGLTPLDYPTHVLLQRSCTQMQELLSMLAPSRRTGEAEYLSPLHNPEQVIVVESNLTYSAAASRSSFNSSGQPGDLDQQAPTNQRGEEADAESNRRKGNAPEEGTVQKASLIIMQCQREKRTGRLELSRGKGNAEEVGMLFFLQGQIKEAVAGRRRGADARNWLSTWGPCHYRFLFAATDTTSEMK